MKAIALVSGGLDSTLATKLMQGLGLELICLNTVSPFCLCQRNSAAGNFCSATLVAKSLGLKLFSINVSDEFLKIVHSPRHGYGSNMNPCIDCRILLFKKAKELMLKEGASFVITGEVLGQRPMSQKLQTMRLIEKESGLSGLVLRPLSARMLEPTIPEQSGWVNRDQLLGICGRGRKEQIALAKEFGINDYPCPAGGCLLTDPQFSLRLKELMQYDEFNLANIQLLKVGRHFRLSAKAKLAVGRNEAENNQLLGLAGCDDYLFFPDETLAGPTCLGRGEFNDDLIKLSCAIACGYCDLNGAPSASILYKRNSHANQCRLDVAPLEKAEMESLRI